LQFLQLVMDVDQHLFQTLILLRQETMLLQQELMRCRTILCRKVRPGFLKVAEAFGRLAELSVSGFDVELDSLLQHDLLLHFLVASLNLQRDLLLRAGVVNVSNECPYRANRLTVELHQNVALPQPGFVRWTVGQNAVDTDPLPVFRRVHQDSQPRLRIRRPVAATLTIPIATEVRGSIATERDVELLPFAIPPDQKGGPITGSHPVDPLSELAGRRHCFAIHFEDVIVGQQPCCTGWTKNVDGLNADTDGGTGCRTNAKDGSPTSIPLHPIPLHPIPLHPIPLHPIPLHPIAMHPIALLFPRVPVSLRPICRGLPRLNLSDRVLRIACSAIRVVRRVSHIVRGLVGSRVPSCILNCFPGGIGRCRDLLAARWKSTSGQRTENSAYKQTFHGKSPHIPS